MLAINFYPDAVKCCGNREIRDNFTKEMSFALGFKVRKYFDRRSWDKQ